MSWDLEQLAAHKAATEQRRSTEVAERSQPTEAPSRAASRVTTRPSSAGGPSVGGNERAGPGESRESAALRATASAPAPDNRQVRAPRRPQLDEQQTLATSQPVTRPSTTDPRVHARGNLTSSENQILASPESVTVSTQSPLYHPPQTRYPILNRAPTEDQTHNNAQFVSGNQPEPQAPSRSLVEGRSQIRNQYPSQGYNGRHSQSLIQNQYSALAAGDNGNQGGNGVHGAYEAYIVEEASENCGSQPDRGYQEAQVGDERSPQGGTSVEFGVTRSHSPSSNEAAEPSSHNLQSQNHVPTSEPSYTTQLYSTVSGLESSYMQSQAQQQGLGNPGFHLPTINDGASMRNTYGFPPQMPASMNMQMPMQMPPPGGYNAFQNDPIPRPQTQIHNPFMQPPVTGGVYGPQSGYYPHLNGPPSPLPPLMSATNAPPETMTLDMVTHHSIMPFENGPLNHRPDPWGVAKIKNIPYVVTKQEIVHFIGRNSKMITPDLGCAIHITMERSTSKTMDCYVEFMTQADADAAVAKINRIYETGRIPRLGSRHVDVEVSSQDALLRDLFPRAKQIIWKNGVPHLSPNEDPYSTGFQGFFTHEEIFLLIRHAEHPQRSPFSVKCLWRAYECTISTLKKFPWFATNMYTVEDRNQLFTVTLRHINALLPKVEKSKVVGLDRRLLTELLDAGLKCPGFNERQKFALFMTSKSTEYHRLSATARYWPFDTLSMKANTSDAIMMHYANLIQKGLSVKDPSTQTLANSYHPQYQGESPFGRIWLEWGFSNTYHKFQAAVEYELQLVRSLVLEGYTANPVVGPVVPVVPDSAARSREGDQRGAQLVPPPHLPPPHGAFNAPFTGASAPFVLSSGPLPAQMAAVPPGSMPIFPLGFGPAGPHPHPGFNVPIPQFHQQQHIRNITATTTTTPITTTTTTASPKVNVGGGDGGAGRVGGPNNQSQNQNHGHRQVQGRGHGHGQGQDQGSSHRSNRHPAHQSRHTHAANSNNPQKKRH